MEVCLPNGHQLTTLLNDIYNASVPIYSAARGWNQSEWHSPDMFTVDNVVLCTHCFGVLGPTFRQFDHLPHHKCNQQIELKHIMPIVYPNRILKHWKSAMLDVLQGVTVEIDDVDETQLTQVKERGGPVLELSIPEVTAHSMFDLEEGGSWQSDLPDYDELDTKLHRSWCKIQDFIDEHKLLPNFMTRNPATLYDGQTYSTVNPNVFVKSIMNHTKWGDQGIVYRATPQSYAHDNARSFVANVATPQTDCGNFSLSHWSRSTTPLVGGIPAVFSGFLTGSCDMHPYIKGTEKVKTFENLGRHLTTVWSDVKMDYALGPGGFSKWYTTTMQQSPITVTPAALKQIPTPAKFRDSTQILDVEALTITA
uniref:Sigma 3 n=1 Tax=Phocid orthoreovirus 1 TaxID=2854225 RepID=A0A7L5EVJ0_9REOV|nr:Sigma 3 [Phocid orthoreovirus 1]